MQYAIYRLLFSLLTHLPWAILLRAQHAVAWLLGRVLKYRRQVVRDNLARSFPSLSHAELRSVEDEFYTQLVGNFLLSPKMLSTSSEVLQRAHLKLTDTEQYTELMNKGHKHFIVLMGHCGNWELFSAGHTYFSALGIQQIQLYRRLKNTAFDRLQQEQRERYGAICIPKEDAGKLLIQRLRDSSVSPTVYAFIADQTPRPENVGLWLKFLEQDTAFLNGAERLARKFDLPVFYMRIEPKSALCYEGQMILISEQSAQTEVGEITKRYAQLLEENIRSYPAHWLWSHKRWKFARPSTELEHGTD